MKGLGIRVGAMAIGNGAGDGRAKRPWCVVRAGVELSYHVTEADAARKARSVGEGAEVVFRSKRA